MRTEVILALGGVIQLFTYHGLKTDLAMSVFQDRVNFQLTGEAA